MRVFAAVLMTAMILLPIQASAATGQFWDHARYDSDGVQMEGGTIGFTTQWNLSSNNDTENTYSSEVDDMPILVEVYTATWCTNCVTTQNLMNEAIADSDVELIHYHRHWFETGDPFGSNSTEERWTSTYGHAVTLNGGAPRLAPTKVVDGERMHFGTRSNSDSLMDDYATSLSRGQTAPFSGNITFSIHQSLDSINIEWNISSLVPNVGIVDYQLDPWLLLVEESAYFPEGTNNLENYDHILLEAVNLGSESNLYGSSDVIMPSLWDGDDLKIAVLVDWTLEETSSSGSPLPAPGALLLVASLVAIANRTQSRKL